MTGRTVPPNDETDEGPRLDDRVAGRWLCGLAPYPDAAPYAGRTRCFGRLFVIAHDVDHHSIDWPSLITLFLLGLLPHFGFPAVFRGAFGNVTVAFLLFTFVLVYPLSKTFFVRRCAVAFVTNRFARKGPWCFVSFLLFSVTFMGLFISPSVLFVAFMPFLEDIYEVLQIKKKSQTGNMLMLGTASASAFRRA